MKETRWGWIGTRGERDARFLAEKELCFHDIEERTGYARYWHKSAEFNFGYRPEIQKLKAQPSIFK